MTQSGMLLGSDMLVPTLGVPVVGSQQQQQQRQRQGAAVGKHSTKNKTALENGRGPNTSSRPASATPSSSDTDGYMKQSHHKSKRITGSSGSNTSGAPNGGIPLWRRRHYTPQLWRHGRSSHAGCRWYQGSSTQKKLVIWRQRQERRACSSEDTIGRWQGGWAAHRWGR